MGWGRSRARFWGRIVLCRCCAGSTAPGFRLETARRSSAARVGFIPGGVRAGAVRSHPSWRKQSLATWPRGCLELVHAGTRDCHRGPWCQRQGPSCWVSGGLCHQPLGHRCCHHFIPWLAPSACPKALTEVAHATNVAPRGCGGERPCGCAHSGHLRVPPACTSRPLLARSAPRLPLIKG